jgi:hypothetical protein
MKIYSTPLIGLDVSKDPKNIRESDLSYAKNAIINRHGELVSRHGMRLINDAANNLDTDFIDSTKRVRYKQVVSPNREVIDVFSVGNQVFIYDDVTNDLQLIYEAPGDERVDIDSYLGYILVCSQSSNLEIIRKYSRAAYILRNVGVAGTSIIRSTGIESGTTIDFTAEDTLSDNNIRDFDVDTTKLFVSTITDGTDNVSDSVSPSDEEVSIVANNSTNYYDNVEVIVGYRHDDEAEITYQSGDITGVTFASGGTEDNKNTIDNFTEERSFLVSDENSLDFEDTLEKSDTITIEKRIDVTTQHVIEDDERGVYDGALKNGNNITDGTIHWDGEEIDVTGGTFNTKTVVWSMPNNGSGSFTATWNGKQVYFVRSFEFTLSFYQGAFNSGPTKITRKVENVFLWEVTREEIQGAPTNILGGVSKLMWLKDGEIVSGFNYAIGQINAISSYWFSRAGSSLDLTLVSGSGFIDDPRTLAGADAIRVFKVDESGDAVYFIKKFPETTTIDPSINPIFQSNKVLATRTIGEYVLEDQEKYAVGKFSSGTFSGKSDENNVISPIETYAGATSIERCRLKIPTDNVTFSQEKIFELLLSGDYILEVPSTYVYQDAEYSIVFKSIKPYYKVNSSLDREGVRSFMTTFNYNATYTKNIQNNNSIVCSIDINIDFSSLYHETIGASSPEEILTNIDDTTISDYTYTISLENSDATDVNINYYDKDNFDNPGNALTFISKGITEHLICKNNLFWSYISDGSSIYSLFATKVKTNEKLRFVGSLDLTGKTVNYIKSLIMPDGAEYPVVLTDGDTITIYKYSPGVGIVADATYTDPSDTIVDYSVKTTKDGDVVKLYCIRDNDETTFSLDITNDTANENNLFSIGNKITDQNELNHVVISDTDYPNTTAFIGNSEEDFKLITEDPGTDPTNNSGSLSYTIDGAAPSVDKILTDANLSTLDRIKPVSTPSRPTYSLSSSTNLKTGTFSYFFVIRELATGGTLLYESYPSDFGYKITATNQTISLDNGYSGILSGILTDDYTPVSSVGDINQVVLDVYRKEISSGSKYKTTDFYLIESIVMTETDGTYNASTWLDDIAEDANMYETYSKYKGYSDFYPRCKFVEIYNNVVYQANEIRYPNNIYFSELFDPTAWRPQLALAAAEFTNDAITGMIQNDGLYVFTRDEVHIITGIGTNVTKQILTKEVGCVDDRTFALIDRNLYFLSERGVYRLRGYEYTPVDRPTERITKSLTFDTANVAFTNTFRREYKIVYDNNKVLTYSVPYNLWFISEYPYNKIIYAFTRENKNDDLFETVFIVESKQSGNPIQILVEDELMPTDHIDEGQAASVAVELYTKQFEMGNPFNFKVFRKLLLSLSRSHNFTCDISIDEGEYYPMVENVKRPYFNEVPYSWMKFDELTGLAIDSGRRGGTYNPFNVERNADGKTGRCYNFIEGSYVDMGKLSQIATTSLISFWFNSSNLSNTFSTDSTPVVISNQETLSISGSEVESSFEINGEFYPLEIEAYAKASFDSTSTTQGINYPDSGIAQSLDEPSDEDYTTSVSFVPVRVDTNGFHGFGFTEDAGFGFGSNRLIWSTTTTQTGFSENTYTHSRITGSNYGLFFIETGSEFAPDSFDGRQRIYFPKNGTSIGAGYIEFYYDRDAWVAAQGQQFTEVFRYVITQDGSVYINWADPAYLVVDGDGNRGVLGQPNSGFLRANGKVAIGSDFEFHYATKSADTFTGVKITTDGSWSSFANQPSGIKDIQSGVSGQLYYDKSAWESVFLNTNSDIVIASDGSIYKDFITQKNLVITGSGDLGSAALATDGSLSIYGNPILDNQGYIVEVFCRGESSAVGLSSSGRIAGEWTHASVVNDTKNKQVILYINGTQVNSSTYAGTLNFFGNGVKTFVGQDQLGNNQFTGRIDDLRIYDEIDTATYTIDNIVNDIYKWGEKKLNFDRKEFIATKEVPEGRSASFKISTNDRMLLRRIAVEYNEREFQ